MNVLRWLAKNVPLMLMTGILYAPFGVIMWLKVQNMSPDGRPKDPTLEEWLWAAMFDQGRLLRVPAMQQVVPKHPRLGGKALKSRRHKIIGKDESSCFYCGRSGIPLTLDHYIPRSKGGSNSPHNLVPACYECNHDAKDDKTPSLPLSYLLSKRSTQSPDQPH